MIETLMQQGVKTALLHIYRSRLTALGNAVGMADIVIGGFNPWILTPIEMLMNKTNLD